MLDCHDAARDIVEGGGESDNDDGTAVGVVFPFGAVSQRWMVRILAGEVVPQVGLHIREDERAEGFWAVQRAQHGGDAIEEGLCGPFRFRQQASLGTGERKRKGRQWRRSRWQGFHGAIDAPFGSAPREHRQP